MDRPLPIIRLEIEGMRRTIVHALTQVAASMDADIKAAVDAYCTPENVKRVIDTTVHQTLDVVIKEEVRNWFVYGAGREVIKAAVAKRLADGVTWTPLDHAGATG